MEQSYLLATTAPPQHCHPAINPLHCLYATVMQLSPSTSFLELTSLPYSYTLKTLVYDSCRIWEPNFIPDSPNY